jgi:hypothetical protein
MKSISARMNCNSGVMKKMAKWRVEQLKLDPKKKIWSRNGIWQVDGETAQEALRYVFANYLQMADDFDRVISQASSELYGLSLTVDNKSWSVRPDGAGMPG